MSSGAKSLFDNLTTVRAILTGEMGRKYQHVYVMFTDVIIACYDRINSVIRLYPPAEARGLYTSRLVNFNY